MKPMPIRYVRDMDAAQRFYEALGLTHSFTSRPPKHGGPPVWTELASATGGLALHHVTDESLGKVSLSFQAEEPLELVIERLRAAGFEPDGDIVDESFGRSFCIRDPEGLQVQVNENDHELQG